MTTRVEGYAQLFEKATGRKPFPYQRRLAEEPELPSLVRAPTGAGKTAAAVLGWLYRRRFHPDDGVRIATPRRLVYCLPMRVLVEQTLDAVRRWLGALGLAGEVSVFQLMGGVVEEDWVRIPERDAILVGTMDMLLSRALNRGYAAGRFRWPLEFGLLNNDCLWVLDEVQLMGNGLAASAQLAAFRRSFGVARPCPSLWMSATVDPAWLITVDHEAPASVLTLTDADRSGPLGARLRAAKTLRRTAVGQWPDDGPHSILERHRSGTLTLVVVNTVERARRLYAGLKRAAPDDLEVRLLHSRFRPLDRHAAADAALGPIGGAGRIVVATQVVEAGVDTSAATLVTELAPWTSLVQRFGRCNRFGEYAAGEVWWVDLPGDREAAPYVPEELAEAREWLRALEGGSVSPQALEGLGPGRPPSVRHVLRRPDLLDLFDTEPDLAGNDVDVSRFIRDDADVDVQVFWRRWDGDGPPADLPGVVPDELCPVPVWEVREFLFGRGRRVGRRAGYVWDHLDRAWRPLTTEELRPGIALLLPAEAGGYTPEAGWDRENVAPVDPVVAPAPLEPEEGMDDDPLEEVAGAWVALPEHLDHVERQLEQLQALVWPDIDSWVREVLRVAARWHDVGKAHDVFQRGLLATLSEEERAAREGTLWAKSPRTGRRVHYQRPHFRHELASAVALLAAPAEAHGLEGKALDLAAYLVAAHHGKVRMTIRALHGEKWPPETNRRFARGVWDGDLLGPVQLDGTTLPQLQLNLGVMEAGRDPGGRPSWSERVLRLRDLLGPFRLAYLEAILRVADWKASAAEASDGGGDRGA
ncbi:MAG: CRISPR-associated helicase Cas3' [Armatimonadota bacterium]|nr:CRISPR-associated helicase Cas3' [Armatimonadota bacterium]MDR7404611.1 CRISPR-associated helicase Cas3' [Armatimonadota bacterium]